MGESKGGGGGPRGAGEPGLLRRVEGVIGERRRESGREGRERRTEGNRGDSDSSSPKRVIEEGRGG